MDLKELQEFIDKEVSTYVDTSDHLHEPIKPRKPKPPYRTALDNDDEVDEYMFFAGNMPEEEKEKLRKRNGKSSTTNNNFGDRRMGKTL